jgi:hypothetical protein
VNSNEAAVSVDPGSYFESDLLMYICLYFVVALHRNAAKERTWARKKKNESKTYDSDALGFDEFNFSVVHISTDSCVSHFEISVGRHDCFCGLF